MTRFFPPAGLFVLLLLAVSNYSSLPRYFSFAHKIDPANLSESPSPPGSLAIFNRQAIPAPSPPAPQADSGSALGTGILGDTAAAKRIEVDLTRQRVSAYEGDKELYTFLISSGKWDRTPTGTFKIWAKVRSQKMEGGSKLLGTYYYLPNVPYIMFFSNQSVRKELGYSFHGTYWHNNFGYPMSHGCINMKIADAARLYSWIDSDTPITIYGKFQYSVSANSVKAPI